MVYFRIINGIWEMIEETFIDGGEFVQRRFMGHGFTAQEAVDHAIRRKEAIPVGNIPTRSY